MWVHEAVLKGEQVPVVFTIDHGRLLYKERYVLARSTPSIPVLLREYHDSPLRGHAKELKTYLCLVAEWYWEGIRQQVTNFVRGFQICQRAKASNQSLAGLLQNLPIPSNYGSMSPWIS